MTDAHRDNPTSTDRVGENWGKIVRGEPRRPSTRCAGRPETRRRPRKRHAPEARPRPHPVRFLSAFRPHRSGHLSAFCPHSVRIGSDRCPTMSARRRAREPPGTASTVQRNSEFQAEPRSERASAVRVRILSALCPHSVRFDSDICPNGA